MAHDKHIESAEAIQDPASYMTVEERAEAERLRLYATHKAHNSLWMYYYLYSDEQSKTPIEESSRIPNMIER